MSLFPTTQMLRPLTLQSEIFSATGGVSAEGISNQLGRPRADRFTLLVREAVQNSWDARLQDAGGVRFQITGDLLSRDARRQLAATVFHDAPSALPLRDRLADSLDFPVIAISDYGTKGLGGPTRGDIVPLPGESTNFVDFMRYTGRPPNRTHGGGTYGFGKAAYFLASSLRTICVHTCFRGASCNESRFMVSALGPQFETAGSDGRRFTGRHWWGYPADDDIVDPVVGGQADLLAELLGMARAPDATGTTIYVLAPEFQEASPEEAFASMARAIVEFFWPKLIDGAGGAPTMTFGLQWKGSEIALPIGEPQWALLTQAFHSTSAPASSGMAAVHPIACQRPRQHLGTLALLRRPSSPPSKDGSGENGGADSGGRRNAVERPLRHIAVMRAPNFVVKYIEGPPAPYGLAEYAGVFRVDSAADSAFARAEPPTHDDWVPDLLDAPAERTYVRVAQRRIREFIESFAAPHAIEPESADERSVVGFSTMLGGLVPSLHRDEMSDTERRARGDFTRTPKGRSSVRLKFIGEPSLDLVDGLPAMIVKFELEGPHGQIARVTALPRVTVADGFETDPPEGAEIPRVLAWRGPDGAVFSTDEDCNIQTGTGLWTVEVRIPSDAMTTLTLDVKAHTT